MTQITSGSERILAPQVDRSDFGAMPGIDSGPSVDNADEEQADEQPRDHAGEKELAYGLFREDSEYDERHARRYDDTQGTDGCDDAGGELDVVFVAVHLRNGNAREGGGGGC